MLKREMGLGVKDGLAPELPFLHGVIRRLGDLKIFTVSSYARSHFRWYFFLPSENP